MKIFTTGPGVTRIGLAYGTGVPAFLAANPGLIDYVEVPFEQLRHAPELAALQEEIPLVLHCASLSIAGFVPAADAVVDAIGREAARTHTPWIGEHLAFTSADGITEGDAGGTIDGVAAPTELTYTVCPQLSEETLARVVENVAALRPRMPVPLILENSPQYFEVPGSTMSMAELIRRVAEACDVGLLLDLERTAAAIRGALLRGAADQAADEVELSGFLHLLAELAALGILAPGPAR